MMDCSVFEVLPGLTGLPSLWREFLGQDFLAFKSLCLEPELWPLDCTRGKCGSVHGILPQPDGTSALEICCAKPRPCPDQTCTRADLTPLTLSWQKLGREIARALELKRHLEQLPMDETYLIGFWSTEGLPVVLTLARQYDYLRSIITELRLRLERPYVLLAPSRRWISLTSWELLHLAGSAFFTLDTIFTLTPHGSLQPVQPSGKLFAAFTPQPKEFDENTARKVFAVIQKLDSQFRWRKALPSAVFLLYCADGLSPDPIAHKLHCCRRVIYQRLAFLRQKLGRPPAQLRQYSDHFDKIAQSLSDPRARRIERRSAALGLPEQDQQD